MWPASSRTGGLAVGACAALLLTGCLTYTVHGTIPPRTPKPARAHFVAGTARVDLTPIPGVPIGGIGPMAKISRGFWTRLQARALYMEDTDGEPLVLVACDLPIIPSGLTDRVVERLHDAKENHVLDHIGLENLLLAATETHQGPGNYMTDPLHNVFDSPRAGFDPELFDFLVRRIVAAIREAHAQAKQATLARGRAPLDRFFRNRSLEAFLLNHEAGSYLSSPQLTLCDTPPPTPPPEHHGAVLDPRASHDYLDDRACRAVEPDVTVLELASASDPGVVFGLAVFLAVHPVVLGIETEVFSGDLFAVAANLLERPGYCGPGIHFPTVALFNGAQGDVSAIFEPRDRARLLELGEKLAQHVCAVVAAAGPPGGTDVRFRYAKTGKLASQLVADPDHRQAGFEVRTASEALPGAPQIAGAEEARTIFHDLGHREGMRRFVRSEQGTKTLPGQIDLGNIHHSLIPRLLARMDPPELEKIPVALYEIGDVLLVSLPGEFTTTMGRRIRTALHAQTGKDVVLVGLSNGHTTYVTTPEEYDLQHYEGASGYFGPATGPFFKVLYEKLASGLAASSSAPEARDYSYSAGEPHVFKPRGVGWPPYHVDDGLANIVERLDTRLPEREFPTFCWQDGVPRLGGHVHGGAVCERPVPDVAVVDGNGTVLADNHGRGLELVTVVAGVEKDRMEWCAIWMAEPACTASQCQDLGLHPQCQTDPACVDTVHFEVDRIQGGPVTSPSFVATSAFHQRVANHALGPEPPWEWRFWCLPGIDALGLCSGTCEVQHPYPASARRSAGRPSRPSRSGAARRRPRARSGRSGRAAGRGRGRRAGRGADRRPPAAPRRRPRRDPPPPRARGRSRRGARAASRPSSPCGSRRAGAARPAAARARPRRGSGRDARRPATTPRSGPGRRTRRRRAAAPRRRDGTRAPRSRAGAHRSGSRPPCDRAPPACAAGGAARATPHPRRGRS